MLWSSMRMDEGLDAFTLDAFSLVIFLAVVVFLALEDVFVFLVVRRGMVQSFLCTEHHAGTHEFKAK